MLTRGAEIAPPFGVPLAVRDQFMARGLRTINRSRAYGDRVSPHGAAVVAKLYTAGTILLSFDEETLFRMACADEQGRAGTCGGPRTPQRRSPPRIRNTPYAPRAPSRRGGAFTLRFAPYPRERTPAASVTSRMEHSGSDD